ncbi:transposase [Gemmobacter sp.]|uniref:transposase n=1 Tax=Gemmobacter sp. TaxID=1898957 RepID=UPI002AFF3DD8|nr:transposase [Gemmobacter sp.]
MSCGPSSRLRKASRWRRFEDEPDRRGCGKDRPAIFPGIDAAVPQQEDQFNLPLEDAEFAQGVLEAAQEKAEAAMQRARGEEPRKPKRNRGHLPSHLPRVERVGLTRCSF